MAEQKTILIVEDDEDTLKFLAYLLGHNGYRVMQRILNSNRLPDEDLLHCIAPGTHTQPTRNCPSWKARKDAV